MEGDPCAHCHHSADDAGECPLIHESTRLAVRLSDALVPKNIGVAVALVAEQVAALRGSRRASAASAGTLARGPNLEHAMGRAAVGTCFASATCTSRRTPYRSIFANSIGNSDGCREIGSGTKSVEEGPSRRDERLANASATAIASTASAHRPSTQSTQDNDAFGTALQGLDALRAPNGGIPARIQDQNSAPDFCSSSTVYP